MNSENIKKITNQGIEQLITALNEGRRETLTQYLAKRDAYRITESSDMLLYLAGVNEHAVLRIVGSKRWRVSLLLRTIQFFSTMEFTSSNLSYVRDLLAS